LIVERTDFISVPVTDLESSAAFYRDTLGLEQIGEGMWPEFQLGENVSLYLLDPTNLGESFTGPHPSPIALRVGDVVAARSELEAKGVEFMGETFDTGVCHMAHFRDPDGNVLMLHRRYAPRDDGSTR
jgi:catechol 2,3-dioxygenase-like lactoylglutathione lyase family enzyme